MLVALLDDIILDLAGPAGIIFSENQIEWWLKSYQKHMWFKQVFALRLRVEEVGELKAVSGQRLGWQVQSLAGRWCRNSWERREEKPAIIG